MQTYQNARQTGDDCIKCGNPKKMYWCDICECNNETLKCATCNNSYCAIDKFYHDECN